MKAIIKLQQLACKSSTDIIELVMSAYAIAYKLEHQDFVGWCNDELEGYSENNVLPKYRYVHGTIMVSSRVDGSEITANWLNTDDRVGLEKQGLANSLFALVNWHSKQDSFMSIKFEDDVHRYIVSGYNYNIVFKKTPLNALIAFLKFHESEIKRIFSVIRKKILDWALECEDQGILGDEWIFQDEDKEMAKNVINYNIGLVQHMANHNTKSTIHQTAQNMLVTKGDWQSLANFLSDKGINKPEIQELQEIIEIEPNITVDGVKNTKIQQWLSKVAIEANLVARGVEIGLLVEGIKCYFGF